MGGGIFWPGGRLVDIFYGWVGVNRGGWRYILAGGVGNGGEWG